MRKKRAEICRPEFHCAQDHQIVTRYMLFGHIYVNSPYIWYTSEYMYTDIYMVKKTNIYMYMSEMPKKCYVVPLILQCEIRPSPLTNRDFAIACLEAATSAFHLVHYHIPLRGILYMFSGQGRAQGLAWPFFRLAGLEILPEFWPK